jgi:AcrR family transcriptional regulator
MLVFMRALPGRQSRAGVEAPLPLVTRSSAAADQRRRILRAAGELVAKRGYGDVTVELIVKRAHVSYKTFYKHFSGKEECFLALFDRVFARVEGDIRERLAAGSEAWPEQVALVLRTFIEEIVADPMIARAVIVEAQAVGPGIRERYERAIKAFVPLFREGRELNPRGAELPETIESTLAGSVFWSAYQRLVVGEAERLPDLLPEILELILRTYLGEPEARRIARSEAAAELIAA